MNDHHLTKRVHIFNNIPFNDLPVFYQCAEIFTYPSYFEGFGIPIIEALYSGTPVVAAKGSCLEEAGGPDSLYINPDSVEEIGVAFNRILNDNSLRQKMVENGKQFVKRFSDQEQAKLIMNIYEKTCKL